MKIEDLLIALGFYFLIGIVIFSLGVHK